VEDVQVRPERRALFAVLLAGMVGAACETNSKNAKYLLEGSLSQVLEMGYDEVRVLIAPEDLSLQFVRVRPLDTTDLDAGTAAGTSEDYPFELTMALRGEDPPGNRRIDLTELDLNGKQRGVYTRNVLNDPNTTFPDARVQDGGVSPCCATIYFKTTPSPGGKVSGDFNVTFENGSELASGRTVFGSFDAKVVQ
jgi:hypothetical protein